MYIFGLSKASKFLPKVLVAILILFMKRKIPADLLTVCDHLSAATAVFFNFRRETNRTSKSHCDIHVEIRWNEWSIFGKLVVVVDIIFIKYYIILYFIILYYIIECSPALLNVPRL